MTPEKYSETNILNSLTLYLATKFLAAGFLIYWHARDAVQINTTSSGWYLQYSQNSSTYLADPTFAAAYAAAKGLVTFVDGIPAVPRFIVRLTSDQSIGPADAVPVPAVSVEIGASVPLANYELGSTTKWRSRHLVVDSYVRTPAEQKLFKDLLAQWFEPDLNLTVNDHDAGTLAVVGTVEVLDTAIADARVPNQAEATTYEVLLNSRIEYIA
jgi:hypothetical protein